MKFSSVNTFLSCCKNSDLMVKLADRASFYGSHFILEEMQEISKVLPLESLLTNTINSDSPDSVTVVKKMMVKNGMNVSQDMIQTAKKRGVTNIIETLTGDPYNAEHEKENARLGILNGDDKTIAGKCC